MTQPVPMVVPESTTGPLAGGPVVLGTAGHIDHGKSTLVRALTGIDPDRLAEEKARAMTIDLGFAWLTLPSGRIASIVDVPGHERFIKNMLAGVGGIDGALLVIAADEGPMPQTREHLAILDLLGIDRGLVVMTKTDLVDPDWLDLVTAEILEQTAGSGLRDAPIVPVSARTGAGLDTVIQEIDRLAGEIPGRDGGHQPRLAVDRVFTVSGFGTIVTGTLTGGEMWVGQELRLFPRGLPVRVRGLQTRGEPVDHAGPGNRVAVNVAGVAVGQVRRGNVLAPPSLLTPSLRLDARVRLLASAPIGLEQNARVDVFTGAAELPARITLLEHEVLNPGDDGWVQLRLSRPIAVLKGDRFIIRRSSPSETIGGGEIIDPSPAKHRRFRPEVLTALETRATGTPAEILLGVIIERPCSLHALATEPPPGLTRNQVEQAVTELRDAGTVVLLRRSRGGTADGGFLVSSERWTRLVGHLRRHVTAFHADRPLRRGMPREALRAKLDLEPGLFEAVIFAATVGAEVVDENATVRLPSFAIALSVAQRARVAPYLAAIAEQPFGPPAPASFGLDDELVVGLEHLGELVRISGDVAFAPDALAAMTEGTLSTIDQNGSISLAHFRDQFQTSRKYAQAVLEHLDRHRITRRIGDDRIRFTALAKADTND